MDTLSTDTTQKYIYTIVYKDQVIINLLKQPKVNSESNILYISLEG